MRVPANSVIKRVGELFAEFGESICCDEEGWEDNFSLWEAKLIKNEEVPVQRYAGEIEIDFYDLLFAMCYSNGYVIVKYEVDKVFDSPGLDIYVLSFVIKDPIEDEFYYSLNNICERG